MSKAPTPFDVIAHIVESHCNAWRMGKLGFLAKQLHRDIQSLSQSAVIAIASSSSSPRRRGSRAGSFGSSSSADNPSADPADLADINTSQTNALAFLLDNYFQQRFTFQDYDDDGAPIADVMKLGTLVGKLLAAEEFNTVFNNVRDNIKAHYSDDGQPTKTLIHCVEVCEQSSHHGDALLDYLKVLFGDGDAIRLLGAAKEIVSARHERAGSDDVVAAEVEPSPEKRLRKAIVLERQLSELITDYSPGKNSSHSTKDLHTALCMIANIATDNNPSESIMYTVGHCKAALIDARQSSNAEIAITKLIAYVECINTYIISAHVYHEKLGTFYNKHVTPLLAEALAYLHAVHDVAPGVATMINTARAFWFRQIPDTDDLYIERALQQSQSGDILKGYFGILFLDPNGFLPGVLVHLEAGTFFNDTDSPPLEFFLDRISCSKLLESSISQPSAATATYLPDGPTAADATDPLSVSDGSSLARSGDSVRSTGYGKMIRGVIKTDDGNVALDSRLPSSETHTPVSANPASTSGEGSGSQSGGDDGDAALDSRLRGNDGEGDVPSSEARAQASASPEICTILEAVEADTSWQQEPEHIKHPPAVAISPPPQKPVIDSADSSPDRRTDDGNESDGTSSTISSDRRRRRKRKAKSKGKRKAKNADIENPEYGAAATLALTGIKRDRPTPGRVLPTKSRAEEHQETLNTLFDQRPVLADDGASAEDPKETWGNFFRRNLASASAKVDEVAETVNALGEQVKARVAERLADKPTPPEVPRVKPYAVAASTETREIAAAATSTEDDPAGVFNPGIFGAHAANASSDYVVAAPTRSPSCSRAGTEEHALDFRLRGNDGGPGNGAQGEGPSSEARTLVSANPGGSASGDDSAGSAAASDDGASSSSSGSMLSTGRV